MRESAPGFDPVRSLLLTDLYELSMVDAYLQAGMADKHPEDAGMGDHQDWRWSSD